jgi:PAS domain S-box-containing protein
MTDVTDRITNESARVAAERLYRDLVEEIPLITYVHTGDSELRMAYLSPQIEEILGHPATSLLGPGERFLSIVHPDDRSLVRDHPRRSLQGDRRA